MSPSADVRAFLFFFFTNPLIYAIIKMWCSILVDDGDCEDGPKNPYKGISMKFLVFAFDAQSRAYAGS